MQLYVIGKEPVTIPQYGTRYPGEFFDLPVDIAEAYAAEHANLSLEGSLTEPDGLYADEVPPRRRADRSKKEE